ncbi:UDP-glycosyltransferase UGT5-like [Diabrotica virgifera virgifera]|uniref:UDP-glucuronosyltransferase n=1 Tax=Diabrotica virgifera virgifera TaxID=50390 RepID=A0A6P7GH83_DIAVI|nr:UDP-glycosyltransferase UGT5-like [Diabrotica virgifera virgifera]
MNLLLRTFVLVQSVFVLTESYKILGVCPMPAHSHFTLEFRLLKALADRGHEVVSINSHPQKEKIKNFRDVSVEEIEKPLREFIAEIFDFPKMPYISQLLRMVDFRRVVTTHTFKNKNVQDLMKSNETFDLVIMSHFVNDAMVIFAHRFKCPLIILAPGPVTPFNNFMFVNPTPSSYVANVLTSYGSDMNFWERLDNTFKNLLAEMVVHYRYLPSQDAILKDAFPDSPPLSSIIYNASLMLIVTNPSLDDPVPLQPNIKAIGGYHVLPPKPLPKDIQEFMDNSTEGVVFFSMGSNIKSSNFTLKARNAVLNAFSKIPQKVLWKYEEDLTEKPANVKIISWLPQSDILAHNNTQVFISHGGLLGTLEAIHYGVPILGVPVFWDQERNINSVVKKGFGLKLMYKDLEEKAFEKSLKEILNNPKYMENANKRSKIFHDQPMKPMDEAIFWCEYVIRHQGAPHLRSEALNLYWYQLYSMDIVAFVLACLFAIYVVLMLFIKLTIKSNRYDDKKKNK